MKTDISSGVSVQSSARIIDVQCSLWIQPFTTDEGDASPLGIPYRITIDPDCYVVGERHDCGTTSVRVGQADRKMAPSVSSGYAAVENADPTEFGADVFCDIHSGRTRTPLEFPFVLRTNYSGLDFLQRGEKAIDPSQLPTSLASNTDKPSDDWDAEWEQVGKETVQGTTPTSTASKTQ